MHSIMEWLVLKALQIFPFPGKRYGPGQQGNGG
ncbi:MAG: hypothetical protein RLZZ206_244 [Cyanobacteriota bacterium]|jgi:hypothetical protein